MSQVSSPRSGYTLPVFACAAAMAALHWLRYRATVEFVSVNLIEPAQSVEIGIEQMSGLNEKMALAITRSDPGDNLDLTRNTPVWALVEWQSDGEAIALKGGVGIGRMVDAQGQAAIYNYAQKLLRENLAQMLKPEEKIQVTIIMPEGRRLAERTSNAAFGVVEGLSLLGTTGIAQPLTAAAQLDIYREQVQQKAITFDCLVFCVGENGLELAQQLGINSAQLVKTANWLGSLLVEAALQGVKEMLLFGYHGKLIKLAGGIFHTHHHLADGRLEILTAHCANIGLPTTMLQAVFASATTEAALKYLRNVDATTGSDWTNQVYRAIAAAIDLRSQNYIFNHTERRLSVGSVLFDRDRSLIVHSPTATKLLAKLC